MSEQIKLTYKQRRLLDDLDKNSGDLEVGGRFAVHTLQVARSLERRGMINIYSDEYGYRYVSWDDEFHADWISLQEAEFQQAQEIPA